MVPSPLVPVHRPRFIVPVELVIEREIYVVNVVLRTNHSPSEVYAEMRKFACGAIGLLYSCVEKRGQLFIEFLAPKVWVVEGAMRKLCGPTSGIRHGEIVGGRLLREAERKRKFSQ